MAGSQKTYKGTKEHISMAIASDITAMFKKADDAVYKTALSVLSSAVEEAPNRSGNLASTGKVRVSTHTPEDADAIPLSAHDVVFTAPYAKAVEGGTVNVQPASGDFVQKVKSFRRRTKNGVSIVKAHVKTYANSRPVEVSVGTWRVLPYGEPSKGSLFLKNAMIKHIGETGDTLIRNLLSKLKL
jgi:hypothetical protein